MQFVYSDSSAYGRYSDEFACLENDTEGGAGTLDVALNMIYDLTAEKGYKPAVWIGFTDLKFKKGVVDHSHSYTEDMSGVVRVYEASCNLVVHNVMPTHDGAAALGSITFEALAGLMEDIKDKLGLRGFDMAAINLPREVQKSPQEYFTVDVIAAIQFDYVITTTTESHRLKKFVLELSTDV